MHLGSKTLMDSNFSKPRLTEKGKHWDLERQKKNYLGLGKLMVTRRLMEIMMVIPRQMDLERQTKMH